MAKKEGLFCEPASAASVAGLIKLHRSGLDISDSAIVCILTGSGLKDPDLASSMEPVFMEEYPAELEAVEDALELD